jgi:CO dehydrogenase/acetyl-CoA synthase delta subunit
VERRVKVARKVYDERNRRLEAMTDESVETFYSCLLCQSFAPDHVCIITPERLGLCGAYNWLDGKAAYEIDETGPNQPVKKGECLDPVRGIWAGIYDYVYSTSHKNIESFCAYSIMDRPMTSCGCFEAICAYVPELNGVMVVNREFQGETPVGMTFSTLAGNVGGGQQTPGFMGCGKVFLTSRKFLGAEGGFKRLVWMPKELKELLKDDLAKRFTEQGAPNLMDQIADETIATESSAIRAHMEKVGHPALSMDDMANYAQSAETEVKQEKAAVVAPAAKASEAAPVSGAVLDASAIESLKKSILAEVRAGLTQDIVRDIIGTLSSKFLGETPAAVAVKPVVETSEVKVSAAERLNKVSSFQIRKEKADAPIWEVKLGATKAEGGTRTVTHKIGGASAMPFHFWEGAMPNRPLVAMEVYDLVSAKYPSILRNIYSSLLDNPAEMAKVLVDKYGADVISVRLEGTHPEKGNRSVEDSVKLVKQVLSAVGVPLIITGHSHFEKNNEVLKAVAQACAGENLLLNWVEQDNYRTIAGAAMAYGHTLVAQSPIDVNIGKQLNILLTNMDLKKEQIVMDPMTGAIGYGIEYTYSVMERIRQTALGGDKLLCAPMIVSPGQECIKIKEYKATEKEFPLWGDLTKRAAAWELNTAINLLYAGADVMIMYNPDAAIAAKRTISKLMAN